MLITTASIASVVVALIGLLIYWSNPTRMVNRAVCICSLNIAVWLACWHLTALKILFWLKLTYAIGALAPLSFWIVMESILANLDMFSLKWARRNWSWLAVPALLAILPFTDAFIPPHSTAQRRLWGWGYYGYIIGLVSLYSWLFRKALKNIKSLTGGRRLELQVWLGGGCVLAATVYALMILTLITKDSTFRKLEPLAVLLFYAGTAYAITTHRIFDSRQILLVVAEKLILVGSVAAMAYLLDGLLSLILSGPLALLGTTMLALWFAATINEWLNRMFRFYPQGDAARQAVLAAARREARGENLEDAFLSILKGWGQSDRAVILTGGKDSLRGSGIEIASDSPVVSELRRLRWATPERLARERRTSSRASVIRFLAEHELGALVVGEGATLNVLVGVGIAASRRPFTFPQVTQLMELASIMEGALERAHFSAKAQHSEQLATVGLLGASLAHEIRNPLVTIKTFVQLLPKHHHDAVFRDKFFRLIGDEVGRIDQLTEQLLDLASPRIYRAEGIELHPVLKASIDLVSAKAAHRNVQFLMDFQASPDRVFTDASAARQVMLNLCFNAIQAVEARNGGDRWVKIATRNTPTGIEMAVADSGPGIAPEIRPRLFEPFQTTKSSGFGLGLAICSDILANLNASITADPPTSGIGATFRVTFPCQPLSS